MAAPEFRFAAGSSVDTGSIASDVQVLNALSTEQLVQFLDIVMGFLIAPASTDLMAAVGLFAETHGANARTLKVPRPPPPVPSRYSGPRGPAGANSYAMASPPNPPTPRPSPLAHPVYRRYRIPSEGCSSCYEAV